jgi:hypothetical protein
MDGVGGEYGNDFGSFVEGAYPVHTGCGSVMTAYLAWPVIVRHPRRFSSCLWMHIHIYYTVYSLL